MRRQTPAFLLMVLCAAIAPAVQLPYLVKDLNTDARGAYGSGPFNFVSAGERAYFATQSYLETGYSIWTTEGTADNTQRVADFPHCRPPWNGRGPIVGALGDLGLFVEHCWGEEWQQQLWRTDGSTLGTFPLAVGLAEIHTGTGFSIQADSWTRTLNGRLYFGARTTAESDLELWSSDGTEAGTSRLATLPSPPGSWMSFTARAGGRLTIFIQQNTYDFLTDIWSTDGTAAGTLKLASLRLGYAPAVTAGRTLVYFQALVPGDPATASAQLWVTDGTPSGTHPLTHYSAEESAIGCYSQPRIVGDELLFCAYTLESEFEIWRTDGTVAGTFPLSAFGNSSPFPYYAYRVEATRFSGSYYFLGYGDDGAYSLWRSLGTPGAAVRVRKIAPPGTYLYGDPWIEQAGGRLVFWGFDDGWKLYGSDGSAAGTTELTETCPDSCSTFVSGARAFGDRLLFIVQDAVGRELLWSTRGSPETTFPLAADEESVAVASPLIGAELAGNWLYPGRDSSTGFEPWLSDPARPHSAFRLRDLMQDTPGIEVHDAKSRGNELAFSTREDFRHGDFGVYRTDGTGAGTVEIARTRSCSCGLACTTGPAAVYPLDAGIVFSDPEDCESSSLRSWNRSSGEVRPLFGGPEGDRPGYPEVWPSNGPGLVALHLEALGTELWSTDGSEEGTSLILAASPDEVRSPFATLASALLLLTIGSGEERLDRVDPVQGTVVRLRSYPPGSGPHPYATVVGDSAYFQTVDPDEVWRSDGTPEGTLRLLSLQGDNPGAGSYSGFAGKVLFSVSSPETGLQLWTSDGTAAGTTHLRSFPGVEYGLFDFGWIGSRALFPIHTFDFVTGVAGSELWSTDGTGEGTRLEMNLGGDARPEFLDRFIQGADQIYFETRNDSLDRTLWETDGTAGGTRILWIEAGEEETGLPAFLQATPLGRGILFTGTTAADGRELRIADRSAPEARVLIDLRPGPASSSPNLVQRGADRLYFTADDGIHGRELWVLAAGGSELCEPSPTTLCLLDGRYRLELVSASGAARALPLTATTGAFSLAGTDEPDAFFKLIDGSAVNQNHWLFGAGLVAQPFEVRVTDTADGSAELWATPATGLASFGDIDALPVLPTAPVARRAEPARNEPLPGGCGPVANRLCFEDGRYLVEATAFGWNGAATPAFVSALDLGPHEGAFWLFDETALELVVRLRRDPISDRVALAVGSLTNLGYELRVLDNFTGRIAAVGNAAGVFHSFATEDLYPAP